MKKEENPVVLLIDDDASIRDVSQWYIEDYSGKEVISCENVEEAINISGDYHVGLVITDYHMPGAKPEEILNRLRDTYPGVKVVCHTGSTKITSAMGYDQVVYKPKGFNGLVEIVKAELN